MVDKRHVRRDIADVFGTLAEGVRGKRAVQWRLVDRVVAKSRFDDTVTARARELAALSDRPAGAAGIALRPLDLAFDEHGATGSAVSLRIERATRVAHLTVTGPAGEQPQTSDAIHAAGDCYWPLRAFRELDAVLLHLRFNEPLVGTVVVRTLGDGEAVRAIDATLAALAGDWLVREIVLLMKRTLKRMDLTAKSFIALIEPGSCFAGSLFELALASDRAYMLDDEARPATVALSPLNFGPLPMSNGLTRLETRFLGDPQLVADLRTEHDPFDPLSAMDAGLVTAAPDEIDWDDEVRLAVEARAAMSPDALTGLEANLRFAGPETLETKVFGRLTAWQNWIFQRPNAVGEKGALRAFGNASGRAEFDYTRT